MVRVENLPAAHNGIYTVMDTGPKVHGRHLDIYIWNCDEALELGRRQMVITVLRMGWNPRNSTPKLVDHLFRQREAVLPPPPAWPPPSTDAAKPLRSKIAEKGWGSIIDPVSRRFGGGRWAFLILELQLIEPV